MAAKSITVLLCVLYLLSVQQRVEAVGNLVIVGGALLANNSHIYERIIDWAGGAEDAAIGIISAASTNPAGAAADYINVFRDYGVEDVTWIPVHIGNLGPATDPEWIAEAMRMTGFFFAGGQQWRVMESLLFEDDSPTPLLEAIQETYRDGAVMSGTSAGAATQNVAVVVEPSGRSYEGLLKGSIPRGEASGWDLAYLPSGGMGAIEGYIIDSHFAERGREARLPRLCWDLQNDPNGLGALQGIGLDEDTALAISNVDEPNAFGEVLGSNGVMFFDLRNAIGDDSNEYFRITNMTTHYLTHGDTIVLETQRVDVDLWKSRMAGNEEEENAESSENVFSYQDGDNVPEYIRVARSLFNARGDNTATGRTAQTNPRFEVFMHEIPGQSEGWIGEHPYKHVTQVSYTTLLVDMYHLE